MKVNTHSVGGVVAPQIWDMGSQKKGLLCRGSATQFVMTSSIRIAPTG